MAALTMTNIRRGGNDSPPSSAPISRSSSQDSGDSSASSAPSIGLDVPARAEDPTAIVGLACRLPGAQSPSTLWENVVKQKDLQSKIPENRFNVDAFYNPVGAHKGTTNATAGYFLQQDISLFDPEFFHISGKEAEAMDPQQRLLLEVVYEALENAGITLSDVDGSSASVYCGCFTNDYKEMINKDLGYYPKYTATGTGNSILANRISYFYNLHGPSVTVDTACSSSLVALHMGNRSVQDDDADFSIVVGSSLHFDPNMFVMMTDLGFLSSDGRCRAFDASGKGYVRGEGICAVVLKKRSRALARGTQIRAIIRGTEVNHDGAKDGITMPNSYAQEDLIRATYKHAGIEPKDTQYFEAHGTGTQAGDPRESRAIGAVFAENRDSPLYVGSVKTNIGHLEGASGLAGVIKTVLSLEHGKIPPNMLFNNPNPNIDFEKYNITVPTKLLDWKANQEGVKRASINSFGYGGTNAHAILEGHNAPVKQRRNILSREHALMVRNRPFLFPLTSHSEKAGTLRNESLAEFLKKNNNQHAAASIACSLGDVGRTMHKVRSFLVDNNEEHVAQSLMDKVAWTRSDSSRQRIGFVFTGQGAQSWAMGRQLIEECPLFRQTLDRCDDVLQSLPHKPDWSIVTELTRSKESSRIGEAAFSQPLCTAIQIALVDLLEQWGIKPSITVGHSAGEMGAAYAAGILTFDDAIVAAYYRGLTLSMTVENAIPVEGAMMAVQLTEAEASSELKKYAGQIAIAAVNSPTSLTLSGDKPAIMELHETLKQRNVFARVLQIDRAYHSHHIAPFGPVLSDFLRNIRPMHGRKEMSSSVTARLAESNKMKGDYWVANLTGQVRFADALTNLLLNDEEEINVDILLEVGPHPALKGPVKEVMKSLRLDIPYVSTLARGVPDFSSLLSCAGQLFALGYPVDLPSVNSNLFLDYRGSVRKSKAGEVIKLPKYTWDHSASYWHETRLIKNTLNRPSNHEILGAPVPDSVNNHPRWRSFLRPSEMPWLSQHQIEGKIIFPAAGYITMAMEAVVRLDKCPESIKHIELHDVQFKAALPVRTDDMGTEVILEMQPVLESAKRSSDQWYDFIISSYDADGRCSEHCHGIIGVEAGASVPLDTHEPRPSLAQLQKRSDRTTTIQRYYEHLASMGLQYGDDFRLLSGNIESGPGFAMAPLTFSHGNVGGTHASDVCLVHPTLLDASFHVVFAGAESLLGRSIGEPFVPTFMKSMKVSGLFQDLMTSEAQQRFWVSSDTSLPGPRVASSNIAIQSDDCSKLMIEIYGGEFTALGSDTQDDSAERKLFFQTRWQPAFSMLGSADFSRFESLGELMGIFAHQIPNSTVLHISANVESMRDVLTNLGGHFGKPRRFQSYTPYTNAKDLSEQFIRFETEWPGRIDLTEPKEGSFDAIILEGNGDLNVKSLLKPNGYIISRGVDFDHQGLKAVFTIGGTSAWQYREAAEGPSEEPLTLVMPTSRAEHSELVATAISKAYPGKVNKISLLEVNKEATAENVIVLASLDNDTLFEQDQAEFEAIQSLLTRDGNVVWITKGAVMDSPSPQQAIILGLSRVARSENENLRCVVLDVASQSSVNRISDCAIQVLNRDIQEDEFCDLEGKRLMIPKVEADAVRNSRLPANARGESEIQRFNQDRPLALKIGKVGLLETLSFADDEEIMDESLRDDEIEIQVKASALNFRDVAASMGIIDDYKLGDECAGVVRRVGAKTRGFEKGDRVVAWRPGQGAHRSILRNPAVFCRKTDMPFTTATAFPLVLTTAHYALVDTARLQAGEYVLIHSAAGGVGQMAIQVAQMIGAEVIATVGSDSKRQFLKDHFGLEDSHILSSHDTSFVDGVREITKGVGVHVALNSLAGELLHATWKCIARFGRFVEIGKRDIHENAKIAMDPFRKNVSFASVDMITVFEYNRPLGERVFQECCNLIEKGTVKIPESVVTLPYADAQKGFRMLQMGKHLGKVVLFARDNESVPVTPSTYRNVTLFDPSKIFLLVGGLGGLGRTLAEWMVRKGARRLAFLSRSGASRPEAASTVQWLEARDIQVTLLKADVTDFDAVKKCVEQLGSSLAGVFQAAMVLQDIPFDKMSYKQWQISTAPKIKGTYNLHQATLHSDLDFFVCFSSASAVVGAMAQANYSAANTYLDALMSHRRSIGLEAVTMNCGMIVGVGAVSEDAALENVMRRIGYDAVNEEELLYQIEEAVTCKNKKQQQRSALGGIDEHQTITGINLTGKEYYWCGKPLLRNLYANLDLGEANNNTAAGKPLMESLREANDNDERVPILTEAFKEKISSVLGVSDDIIQPANPLSAYGLDSIVAIEFRKWFMKAVNVDLQIFDILGAKSITELVTKAVGLIKFTEEAAAAAPKEEKKQQQTGEAAKSERKQTDNGAAEEKSSELAGKALPANVPMSTFQRRMWFQHNLLEDKSSLNLPITCQVKGSLDVAALEGAVREIKRRNESLRTAFFEGDDFSEQKTIDDYEPHIIHKDLTHLPEQEKSAAVNTFVDELRHKEMEIEEGEVMRMSLIKTADDEWTIALIYHHICIDRGSSKSMFQQTTALYEALRNGAAADNNETLSSVPSPQVSYAEFTMWHETRLRSKELEGSMNFWKENLSGAPAASQLLPFAKTAARPEQMDTLRSMLFSTLETSMLGRMKRICSQTGTTPFQFLMACFRSFHYRYTEQEDLTIHMVDGGRPHPDLEDTIGFFVNLIPIRFTKACDGNFDSLLEYTKSSVLTASEHSSVPFDAIVDALKLEKSSSHFPLGQVIINYQSHGKMPRFKTQDFEIDNIVNEDIPTAGEMQLEALEDPEKGLDLRLEYSSTLYGQEETERFFDNFMHYLRAVIKDHRQPIAEVEMCGPKELEHLRQNMWNTEVKENTWEVSVLDKFLEKAMEFPEQVAIAQPSGSITYEDLAARSKRIAASLQQSGAGPKDVVGVLSKPGIDAISAMLGALLAGCGYLPMDPEFAIDRLTFMAKDAHARYLLADDACIKGAALPIANDTSFEPPHLIHIDDASKCKHHLYPSKVSPGDTFYVVYTSGSTGKPKGVALTQANTHQMLSSLQSDYEFSSSDKFLHQSSICFDLSIVQIFSALTSGATVCVAAPDLRKDPAQLAKYMQESSITVTYFTPTQFALLLETGAEELRACQDYRVAFFAGEKLPVRLAKAFHDLKTPATMYNTWSPSELVVQTTIGKVEYPQNSTTNIPIGKPLANCRHYVLDNNKKPLPAGIVGELCVGGAQVAAGYLDRPEANANSFIDNPFRTEQDSKRGWTRFFKTGDRGRFLPDGSLEFHGRVAGDQQIKLRGFRIDLGEVEHRIHVEAKALGKQRKLVDLSVVAMPKTQPSEDSLTDERQIIAFLVYAQRLQEEEKAEMVTALHQKIATHLNYYMLPSGYQFLNALPVTIGGKVDRQALLSTKLNLTYPTSGDKSKSGGNSANGGEDDTILPQLLKLFKDILKLPAEQEIKPTDDFFELGGQSILLLRAHSKIKRTFKIAPSLKELFTAGTPEGMAQRVRDCIEAKNKEAAAENASEEKAAA